MLKTRLLSRLIFATLAGVACFLMALALEGGFKLFNVRQSVRNLPSHTLFFYTTHVEKASGRAALATAKSGDVEITLTWNNKNDLDLHCIDPNGEHLYYAHKRALQSKGELDIDKNAGPPYSPLPAEHVYWPRRDAPDGAYKVYVDEFQRHGDPDPTPFEITTKEYGRIKKYQGTIQMGRDRVAGDPGQFVCEFVATPSGDKSPLGRISFLKSTLVIAIWVGFIALAIASSILVGLIPVMVQNGPKKQEVLLGPRIFGLRLGYLEGRIGLKPSRFAQIVADFGVWGLFAGFFGQLLYGFLPEGWLSQTPNTSLSTHPTWSYAIVLVLIGGILGAFVGRRVPHIPRFPTCLACILAGLLGSRLFFLIYWAGSEMWGRVAVATLFGIVMGMMVDLPIEEPVEPEVEELYEDKHANRLSPLTLKSNRSRASGTLSKSPGRK